MTVRDVYNAVAQLGFETTLEDDARFLFALNRAVADVNRIRPAKGFYVINHFPLKNLITLDTSVPQIKNGSEELVYECTGAKAYYFVCDGIRGFGSASVEYLNGDEWLPAEVISFTASYEYKGLIQVGGNFVSAKTRIRFSGDYSYSVKNVAMYENVRSTRDEDIPPFGTYIPYDIADKVSDFLYISSRLVKDNGERLILDCDYFIKGKSTILLPTSKPGYYEVEYAKTLSPIEEIDESEMNLPGDLLQILHLQVAGYVWLDDEPQKSEYYFALYREQEQKILYGEKNTSPVIMKNTSGW